MEKKKDEQHSDVKRIAHTKEILAKQINDSKIFITVSQKLNDD